MGSDVGIDVTDGVIYAVAMDASSDDRERIKGIVLPGLPNLHCHAFQRAMAALAETRGPANDSFWTWRQVMYRFLSMLSPEDVEAIAAFAYMEMLEAGFTSVGEFHYLHHDPAGAPYADLAEMSWRIASAAKQTGIGVTLLPSFYANGTFGGAPPLEGQRRFINSPRQFAKLMEGAGRALSEVKDARLGIAPHSLRAVTPDSLREVVALLPDGPVHIHAAEQTKEVDDCVAWSGLRPVEWLLANHEVGPRWCLIHATHMTREETEALAKSGAVAGLCPLTEASLGDGIFDGARYVGMGGQFGVGSDSNIEITAPGELKQLEYAQRLQTRGRNVLAQNEGESSGRRLYMSALEGGAQALHRKIGALHPGNRADFIVLDENHPDLAAATRDGWLDAFVFVAGRTAIRDVYTGGEQVVSDGRHHMHSEITQRFMSARQRISTV